MRRRWAHDGSEARHMGVRVKSQILLWSGPVRPRTERSGSGVGWRVEQEAAYDCYIRLLYRSYGHVNLRMVQQGFSR